MTAEVLYGLMGAATLAVAALSPPADRRPAVAAAVLILVGYFLYNAPWHGWGLRHAVNVLAATAGHPEFVVGNAAAWAAEDTLVSMILVLLWGLTDRPWLILLWVVVVAEVGAETVYGMAGDQLWLACERVLDASYLLSCAVVCGVGGPGVLNRVAGLLRRLRDGRRQAATTHREAGAR
jgi:hypothetical protein